MDRATLPRSRRVARLVGPDAQLVGYLVVRVATHWDTVGPHARPQYVNPEDRLEWRVAYADPARPDLYSDDPAAVTRGGAHDIETGHLVLDGSDLRVAWLDGAEADAVWRDLRW